MKFSVVLATLNRSNVIERAINSIINQTISDFEIIIIDQSDNKKTYNKIQNIINKYDNILYYNVDFKGISKARNFGIHKAKGEFICLMDDDAEYEKDFLKKASDLLNKKKYDILSGIIIDKSNNKVFTPLMEKLSKKEINYHYISVCSSASLVIRKELLNDIGMFDECLGVGQYFGAGEEIDLLIRALDNGSKILYCEDMIVYHPYPTTNINNAAIKRAFIYGLGEGALNKKCIINSKRKIFFVKRFLKNIIKTILAILLYIYNKNKRDFYKNRLKGLIKGFKEYNYDLSNRGVL